MSIVLHVLAIICGFSAWLFSDSNKMPLLIIAAVVLFGTATFTSEKRPYDGDCFIEWDGFSNSEVC